MRPSSRQSIVLLLSLLSLLSPQVSSFRQKTNLVTMCKDTTQESSVLRELKDTITKQSKEIESLKSQLSQNGVKQNGGGGAHGGGPEMQTD